MLVLVRHGETEANAERRLSGRGEVGLTSTGRAQVSSMAAVLRTSVGPIAEVVSSPLGRAVETARGLAAGEPVRTDERWTEIDYGDLEGRRTSEVPPDFWAEWQRDPDRAPPGGESLQSVRQRVGAVCEELFAERGRGARRPDGAVLVVSHVSPIKAAVTWALDCDDRAVWRLHLSTGSLTVIGWSGAPVLHAYNWRPDPPVPEVRTPTG